MSYHMMLILIECEKLLCVLQTDLAGIRWCRLHLPPNSYYADPLEDPVLLSFSKCIQADMLCAWRRQPSVAGVRLAEQMAGPKELWTFWYGEEPATLQDIKASAVFGKPQIAERCLMF